MRSVGKSLTIGAIMLVGTIAAVGAVEANPATHASHAVSGAQTFSVSITPNGQVITGSPCTYTANISGGTAPYHFAWAVNNSPVGSDAQSIQYTAGGGGGFRIDVHVTDNNSDTGYDSNIMTTGGTHCGS